MGSFIMFDDRSSEVVTRTPFARNGNEVLPIRTSRIRTKKRLLTEQIPCYRGIVCLSTAQVQT